MHPSRKMKAIDRELFRRDLEASKLCKEPSELMMDLVSCYNTTLSDLLDKHAPLLKRLLMCVLGCLGLMLWLKRQNKFAENMKGFGRGLDVSRIESGL